MTEIEKKLVLSHNFELMLRHANIKVNNNLSRKKLTNAIEYIRTKNITGIKDLIWDLPKGRPELNEKPLDTAIRETEEELSLNNEHYKILLDLMPVITSYIDYEVTYNFMFYFAEYLSPNDEWTVDNLEVEHAQWFTIDEIKEINSPLTDAMITILTQYKEYCDKC